MMPAIEVSWLIIQIYSWYPSVWYLNHVFDLAYLKRLLEEHVEKLAVPVRVYRSEKRIGLVRARLMGANEATGNENLLFKVST